MQKLVQGIHHFLSNIFPSQRELFERLAETMGSEITQQRSQRGFFDKVKDALGV